MTTSTVQTPKMDLNLIRIVIATVFLCISAVGNSLSFIAVTNKHCKKSSYTVYIAALAIADLLAMISLTIPRYLGRYTVNLNAANELYCKLRLFVTYTCSGTSLWLVILLALERTFCMYFPFKVKSVCRPRTALLATAFLVTFMVANNSHYIYGMRLQQVSQYGELSETSSRSESENENVTLPISELAPFGNLSNGNNDNHNHSGENKDELNRLVFKGDRSANHATDSIHDGPANSAHDDQTDKGKSDMTTNFVCTNSDLQSVNQSRHLAVDNSTPGIRTGVDHSSPAATDTNLKTVGQSESNGGHTNRPTDATLSTEDSVMENCTSTQSTSDGPDCSIELSTKTNLATIDLTDNIIIETYCGFVDQNYILFYQYWLWVETGFILVLPVIIMVAANTATWIKAYTASRGNLTTITARTLRRTRHVIILTSLISIAYIVFVVPLTVWLLIDPYVIDDSLYNFYNETIRDIIEVVAEALYYANHSLNFLFYILSGSRFRNNLKAAFCKPKQPQFTPGTFIKQPVRTL